MVETVTESTLPEGGRGVSSPARRQRAKHTRSKKGCKVCRIRRVRCDLTQPECNRCTSTGRRCTGYPIDGLDPLKEPVRPRNSGHAKPAALVPRYAPYIINEEQRHFSYFRDQTAPRFGGYFEDDLWNQIVLQLAMSEVSIRQVTIAVGILHEKFDRSRASANHLHLVDEPANTTMSYCRAVQCLQSLITDHGWAKLEVVLIACILCVGFEWLRGNPESASIHLSAGLQMLKHWYAKRSSLDGSPSFDGPTGRLIREKIAPFYNRLALQAGSLYDFSLEWPHLPITSIRITSFTTLNQARDSLVDFIGRMQLVPETRALLQQDNFDSNLTYRQFQTLLEHWKKHFDDYTTKCRDPVLSYQNQSPLRMVKLLYLVTTMMLLLIRTEDTDVNGMHSNTFQQILYIAEQMLATGAASFTIDLGPVAMVYYVAIHCPQPAVYEKAFQLLETYQLQEGYWNSSHALRDARKKHRQRMRMGRLNLEYLRWSQT